jgi:hypothetical protein
MRQIVTEAAVSGSFGEPTLSTDQVGYRAISDNDSVTDRIVPFSTTSPRSWTTSTSVSVTQNVTIVDGQTVAAGRPLITLPMPAWVDQDDQDAVEESTAEVSKLWLARKSPPKMAPRADQSAQWLANRMLTSSPAAYDGPDFAAASTNRRHFVHLGHQRRGSSRALTGAVDPTGYLSS